MAEAWPSQLQQSINVDGFSIKLGKTTIRSDMDTGLQKVRSRFTDSVDLYTVSINLDIDQYPVFQTFFKTTLGNGVRTFNHFNPMTNTTDEFRFTEEPSFSPLGGRYFRATMSWERIP